MSVGVLFMLFQEAFTAGEKNWRLLDATEELIIVMPAITLAKACGVQALSASVLLLELKDTSKRAK